MHRRQQTVGTVSHRCNDSLLHLHLLVVAHHRQEYIFIYFSPITFKFPDFFVFSRLTAIRKINWANFSQFFSVTWLKASWQLPWQ